MAYEIFVSERAPQYEIPIVYEDNHLLCVIKPVGMPAQEDRSGRPDLLSLLKDYLVKKYDKKGEAWLGLVHRLDQPVSGLMLFAKTSKAASRLSEAFRSRRMDKIYHAVTRGLIPEDEGRWTDRISDKKMNGRYFISPSGKPASLSFKVLKRDPEHKLSLLRISLDSGRSHQIRVQSSSRHYPLAGDRRYGLMDDLDQSLDSPALFASELIFEHPVKKEQLRIVIDLPSGAPWNYFG